MNIQCPRCKALNTNSSRFCNNCGIAFAVPVKAQRQYKDEYATQQLIKFGKWFVRQSFGVQAGIVGVVVVFIGAFLLIGITADRNRVRNTEPTALVSNTAPATPAPAPEPQTPAEFLAAAKPLLTQKDMTARDKAKEYLKQIPKTATEYKEAQKTLAAAQKEDLEIKREAERRAKEEAEEARELALIGERPSDADLYVAFNRYLRPRLNDYDSSEYVNYTPAVRITVAEQPFWVSTLRLRAKNAFGGYILKDVRMYIRNKEVIISDGL